MNDCATCPIQGNCGLFTALDGISPNECYTRERYEKADKFVAFKNGSTIIFKGTDTKHIVGGETK